jgi:hypothetical protein
VKGGASEEIGQVVHLLMYWFPAGCGGMEGPYSLVDSFFRRAGGAGLDHLGQKAGLFIVQDNRHGGGSLLLSQYRMWDLL